MNFLDVIIILIWILFFGAYLFDELYKVNKKERLAKIGIEKDKKHTIFMTWSICDSYNSKTRKK